MPKFKKAQTGIKTKAPVDSTAYFFNRITKAEKLYDKAQEEKLGKDYNQKHKDYVFKTISDYRGYKKRQSAATPSSSTASLKGGGTIPSAKCGTKAKKK